ncbi:MAG: hypothetical protein ABIN89_02445, partial [Chitinophagaceae bacterium]
MAIRYESSVSGALYHRLNKIVEVRRLQGRARPRPVAQDTCGILSTSPINILTVSYEGGGKPRPLEFGYLGY